MRSHVYNCVCVRGYEGSREKNEDKRHGTETAHTAQFSLPNGWTIFIFENERRKQEETIYNNQRKVRGKSCDTLEAAAAAMTLNQMKKIKTK